MLGRRPFLIVFSALLSRRCGSESAGPSLTEVDGDWDPASLVESGRPTAMFVWASWCDRCMDLLPEVSGLAARGGESLRFVAISILEDGEALPEPRPTALEHYVWRQDVALALDRLGISGLPGFLVFDSNGDAAHRLGSSEAADIADAIDSVLRTDHR